MMWALSEFLAQASSFPQRQTGTIDTLTGAGGLYAALILDDLGIPYQIIEAQDRVGGRLFTYTFPNDTGKPYNYFDVGAMRFPYITSMARLFHLFDYGPLNTNGIALKKKLRNFYFTNGNAYYSYNGVTVRQNAVPAQDPFKANEVIQDVDPAPYIAAGTEAIVNDVINPFATRILQDLEDDLKHNFDFDKSGTKGWTQMQSFDLYSTRAYMSTKYLPTLTKIPYQSLSTDVANWCETFDKSTGWYDRALSETVLESITFGWQPPGDDNTTLSPPQYPSSTDQNPPAPSPQTKWYCVESVLSPP